MNDYERDILAAIEKSGWFCTSVRDPKGIDPAFSYSIGFTRTLCAPEFIVFGMDSRDMHEMLWLVFDQIKAGKQVVDGASWSGILQDFDCVSRAVDPTNIRRDYFNSAMWFWGDPAKKGALPAYQLVWPSATTGLFPWDTEADEEFRAIQPALYEQRLH